MQTFDNFITNIWTSVQRERITTNGYTTGFYHKYFTSGKLRVNILHIKTCVVLILHIY